jgi:Synergist-CTERM protein sorting domain-containing protein
VTFDSQGGGYALKAGEGKAVTITCGTTELTASDDEHAISVPNPQISGEGTKVNVNEKSLYYGETQKGDENVSDSSGGGCDAGFSAAAAAVLALALALKKGKS